MDWSHLRRVRSGKNWGICEEDWLGYLDTVIPSHHHREAQALPNSNSLGKGNYFVLRDTALPYVWTPEEAAAEAKPMDMVASGTGLSGPIAPTFLGT